VQDSIVISNLSMSSLSHSKRLSCGVLVLNPARELLLCHVTGQNHWDLPKGGIEAGETPLQAALRETVEESGLQLRAETLLDLGRLPYTHKKNLHLFAVCMPRFDLADLHCESHYLDRPSGRLLPEMDGYGWFDFTEALRQCSPKMAVVLGTRLDLYALLEQLVGPAQDVAAAA